MAIPGLISHLLSYYPININYAIITKSQVAIKCTLKLCIKITIFAFAASCVWFWGSGELVMYSCQTSYKEHLNTGNNLLNVWLCLKTYDYVWKTRFVLKARHHVIFFSQKLLRSIMETFSIFYGSGENDGYLKLMDFLRATINQRYARLTMWAFVPPLSISPHIFGWNLHLRYLFSP